ANPELNTVSVLPGNGDGTFQPAQSYAAGFDPVAVAVGDFDGNGHPDLAVANDFAPNGAVSIMLGKGDGTFQAARIYAAGINPSTSEVRGLGGEGHLGLAVADHASKT